MIKNNDTAFDITLERKRLLMCEPHMIAFTMIMKHEKASPAMEAQGVIAMTNGDVVWYGSKFAELDPNERCYIFVHELMHGIFMHPDRAQLIRLTKGTINPALFNYAGDAIINEGIDANPTMSSGLFAHPKKFPPVKMAMIHQAMAEAIELTGQTPPSNYKSDAKHGMQVEVIYDWLMWAADVVNKKRREDRENCPRAQEKKASNDNTAGEDEEKGNPSGADNDGDDNEEGSEGSGASDGKDGEEDPESKSKSKKPCTCGQCPPEEGEGQGQGQNKESGEQEEGKEGSNGGDAAFDQKGTGEKTLIERMAGETAWDIQEQIDRLNELLEKGITPTELIEQINSKMEDSRIRIEQIVQGLKMQGNGQGSLLMELVADLPKPVVPWNKIIRRLVTRGMGTKLNDSYVRFGTSTKTAIARGSRIVPFSPGTTIFTEKPRVLVVLDVSGSHIGMLPVCFSEIWSIAQMRGAIVEVLTFDDGVQEILEIKNKSDFYSVLRKGIKGGGGTTLRGVWKTIEKMRDPYRMVIVMTDGYLCEGEKPKIPVVWMVTEGGNTKFSYGEVIQLPAVLNRAA